MADLKIPLLDLAAQEAGLERELRERVLAVLESRRFVLGPEVAELEQRIAEHCGVQHAIGVASGTDALILSLRALGLEPGGEVITTPFTFYSTASSIALAGGRPVFVDIDPETCLIRPDLIEKAVNKRTRGIIPVHLFGQLADMSPIMKLARAHGLFVLEDACQAIGAEQEGKKAGAFGDAAALSFYPSKNLGGIGDGGMVLTGRDDLAELLRRLRVHGAARQYHHDHIGYNSRLDTIQAAALLCKLPRLTQWARARRENADRYEKRFQDSPVKPLKTLSGNLHVYNNYVVRAPRRDELMAHLQDHGVGCAVYYPEPLHRMACFAPWLEPGSSFPAAERASRECLAIPVYPGMTTEMVERTADLILDFYRMRAVK